MAILKISKQDVLRQQTLEPNWYPATCTKIEMKVSKDKNSINAETTFTLDCDGRDVKTYFNSKAMGMAIPFIEAVTGQKLDAEDIEFDTDKLIGKIVQVKLVHDQFEGRLVNKIEDYLPIGADTTPAF